MAKAKAKGSRTIKRENRKARKVHPKAAKVGRAKAKEKARTSGQERGMVISNAALLETHAGSLARRFYEVMRNWYKAPDCKDIQCR